MIKRKLQKYIKRYFKQENIKESDESAIDKAIKFGYNQALKEEDLSGLKAFNEQSILSQTLINEAKSKVMSYQDMINHIKSIHPKTPENDSIIIHFNKLIRDINGNSNYIMIHINREMALDLQKLIEKRKQQI